MKIAIIGFGGMGNNHRKYIIPRLNDSDYPEKLDIAGIYDISEERKEFAAQLGLHNFNSAEEIFADESIKIVLIATPNDLHKPYVLEALSRGKNVIVEKPMLANNIHILFSNCSWASFSLVMPTNLGFLYSYKKNVLLFSLFESIVIALVYFVSDMVFSILASEEIVSAALAIVFPSLATIIIALLISEAGRRL